MPVSHISNMGIIFTQIFSNFIVFSLNALKISNYWIQLFNGGAKSKSLVNASPKENVVG